MDSNRVDVDAPLDDDSDDGSDSDATTTSSSHERLTREEKLYVLRHTRRQDPQGEEQRHQRRANCCATGSVSRLDGAADSSASSCRTLIIHGSLTDESWARITATGSIPDLGLSGSQHYLTSTPTSRAPKPSADPIDDDDFLLGSAERRRRRNHHPSPSPPAAGANFTTRSLPRSAKDFSSLTYRPSSSGGPSSLYQHDEQENSAATADECCERRRQMKMLQNLARDMNWSLPLKAENYASADQTEETACSALSISDTLLVNNNDISHQLASTVIVHDQSLTRDFSYLTKPPPAYPRSANKSPASGESRNSSATNASRRTKVRRALSRSHPDLSKLGKDLGWKPSLNITAPPVGFRKVEMDYAEEVKPRKKELSPIKTNEEHQQQATIGNEAAKPGDKNSDAVWSTPELVDAILEENFKLRQQVAQHAENIAKLAKFERELSAVTAAHQVLVKSSERKENLEKAARVRLEAEWRRSQEMNAALRNQIELLTSQLALKSAPASSMDPSSADVANQIARRDALIAQLVSQNKELLAHKERQDIEVSAQKTTLHQQRSHIEILESALGRAQQHVNRLEDEFRRQCNDARHLLNGGGTACESNDSSANREMANMEIRIRDLEARLSEKEMLIHLLQRASMDRELGYSATRPLTETVLSRHPSSVTSHHSSQMHQQDASNSNLSPSSSKSVRAASVGAPIRIKTSQQESQTSQPEAGQQSLDNQLRALDQFYQNKQSLIKALQTDKELFPNNYWAS